MATNSLATLEPIEQELFKPTTLLQFEEALQRAAAVKPYLRSVMLAVEEKPTLQQCTPQSIIIAALRAATLRLTVDPAVKQAYIVPRNVSVPIMMGGRQTWVKQWTAFFQAHYLGLFTLAVRTREYEMIDVLPIGEGYNIERKLSGDTIIRRLSDGAALDTIPECDPRQARIWLGMLRTRSGFHHTVHWTVEQIEKHAQTFSPAYSSKDSLWHDPKHRHTMQRKTVLLDLLTWGIKTVGDTTSDLAQAMRYNQEAEADIIDVEPTEPEQELPRPTVATIATHGDAMQKRDPIATHGDAAAAPLPHPKEDVDALLKRIDTSLASPRLLKLIELARTDPAAAFMKAKSAARLTAKEAQGILNAVAQSTLRAFVYTAMVHGTKIK